MSGVVLWQASVEPGSHASHTFRVACVSFSGERTSECFKAAVDRSWSEELREWITLVILHMVKDLYKRIDVKAQISNLE